MDRETRGKERIGVDWKEELTGLVFPRRCPICDDIVRPRGELICPECRSAISFVREPCCKKCGKALDDPGREYCGDCLRHTRSFEAGISLLNYEGPAADSIARIKYHNKREYLDFYADEAVKRCGRRIKEIRPDVLIPVPVHPARLRKRGFNQAEILAARLGKRLEIPVETKLLRRNRKTVPNKNLTPRERLKNLTAAFSADPVLAEAMRRDGVRRILIVDDIYTTGATVEACCRVLHHAGFEKAWFFTIGIGHGT
ncbi:MAG: ComF family protein [[Clostridium] aminophilum]|nr:ComF family protein [[Clostridium] aminophilum]